MVGVLVAANNKNGEDDVCYICLVDDGNEENLIPSPCECKTPVHGACLNQWLADRPYDHRCSICKRPLKMRASALSPPLRTMEEYENSAFAWTMALLILIAAVFTAVVIRAQMIGDGGGGKAATIDPAHDVPEIRPAPAQPRKPKATTATPSPSPPSPKKESITVSGSGTTFTTSMVGGPIIWPTHFDPSQVRLSADDAKSPISSPSTTVSGSATPFAVPDFTKLRVDAAQPVGAAVYHLLRYLMMSAIDFGDTFIRLLVSIIEEIITALVFLLDWCAPLLSFNCNATMPASTNDTIFAGNLSCIPRITLHENATITVHECIPIHSEDKPARPPPSPLITTRARQDYKYVTPDVNLAPWNATFEGGWIEWASGHSACIQSVLSPSVLIVEPLQTVPMGECIVYPRPLNGGCFHSGLVG